MKKCRIILPLLAFAMLFTGCTKEIITYGSQISTYRFNVTPSQWKVNQGPNEPGSDNYLYCELDVPGIDKQVFDYGTVQAYVWNIYDVSNNLGAWNTLPFVYPLEIYDNGEYYVVPENMRFEWEMGKVTLIIQELDGYDPSQIAETISVKVSVTRNM
jgi:hypothetical protein